MTGPKTGGRSNKNPADVGSGNLPHDVIERAAQIVEAVSDNGTDSRIDLVGDLCSTLPMLTVALDIDNVWLGVDVQSNCSFDSIQVFLCPDDFQLCAIE